jgi:hypothetical protein
MVSATANEEAIRTDTLGGLHWLAILLAAVSGAIHLFLGVSAFVGSVIPPALGIPFLLAGLGFLGAIALVFVGWRRPLVYLAGIPYTAVQIVLWYQFNYAGTGRAVTGAGPIEVADKVAQAVLILVLIDLYLCAR